MEYYKPALSGVFLKGACAHVNKSAIHNFSVFLLGRHFHGKTLRCVVSESPFVSKAPNGINEEKQH